MTKTPKRRKHPGPVSQPVKSRVTGADFFTMARRTRIPEDGDASITLDIRRSPVVIALGARNKAAELRLLARSHFAENPDGQNAKTAKTRTPRTPGASETSTATKRSGKCCKFLFSHQQIRNHTRLAMTPLEHIAPVRKLANWIAFEGWGFPWGLFASYFVGMIDEDSLRGLEARQPAILSELDERRRRLFAAAEARAAGWGGIAAVSRVTGVAASTIGRGLKDLDEPAASMPDRVRRPGGGRKPLVETDPSLLADLNALVEPDARGDPMSPLRWTSKSLRRLAEELRELGHKSVTRWSASC